MTPEDSWVARWQRIGKPDDLILTQNILQCDPLGEGSSEKKKKLLLATLFCQFFSVMLLA